MRHVKRWLTIFAISVFAFITTLLFTILVMVDDIDAEMEKTWLFPGDWLKIKIVYIGIMVLSHLIPAVIWFV